MSKKHSNKELLAELRRVTNLLGRPPKSKEMSMYSIFSVNSYKRAFGGLSNAILSIGEVPFFIRNQSTKTIINELKTFYEVAGEVPTIKNYFKNCSTSYPTFRKLTNYKPWHIVLKEIGVSNEELNGLAKKNITNEELKNEVIRLKNLFGRYPTYYDMISDGIFSAGTYEQRFGSWVKAMHKLGFSDYEIQSIYKNQIYVKGKDGIIYKSNFESKIANLLFQMKLNHEIKSYEYEKKVCKEKNWTCDFLVKKDNNEIWVEADGMGENRKNPYNINNAKIEYYRKNNMNYYIIPYTKKINLKFLV